MPYNFEERYNEIREELIKQGYANKHITYSEFLAIYEPYKEEMSEKEFIQVLGISYTNLQSIKHKNKRAIILKQEKLTDEKKKIEELKQFIISDLRKRRIYRKKIDYNEFLSLYEPYKNKFRESEFASILGISDASWQSMKNKGTRAIILKPEKSDDEKKELENLKQFIASDLIQKGYRHKSIDYNEFLRLYEPYKAKFKESEFANILEMTYGSFSSIKYNGTRAIILKPEKSTDEMKELENLKQFIASDLIQKGYRHKSIDYNEFLRLYEPYKAKFKESEFANILGISYSNWQNIKYRALKAIILKPKRSTYEKKKIEELKQFIASDLIQKGYRHKSIDYNEFLRLCEPYKGKLKESEFANILGISYESFRNIKYNGKKAIILKPEKSTDKKKKIEELKQFIASDLIQKGYRNKSIDYNEFLRLYEPYKAKFKESEFANILEMTYGSFSSIKYNGTRAIILKPEKSTDEMKELENLKQFIISDLRKRGYTEKKIDYNEFLSLYEPYKERFKESEFANILGMTYGSFSSIKYNGKKAIILKPEKSTDKKKKIEELKQFIASDLIQKGYRNKSIDYNEFLRLYEPYKAKFKESEFANILGISYSNLKNIKYGAQKAIILKPKRSTVEKKKIEELKQFIASDLIQKGYRNKSIDYNEFLRLYEQYIEKLKESEFANILGISYSNWRNIKYYGQRAIILKPEKSDDEKKELENLKQVIISDLIERGYTNKKIDYNEFLSLYEPYKEKFKESEFANILEMTYGSFSHIKYSGGKAIIFKRKLGKKELEKLKKLITSDLIQKGYRHKSIDYNEFFRLYEPYKGKLKESEFANILGISYVSWQNIKNKAQKAVINFEYIYYIRILHLFKESKEYDLAYFEEVSKNIGLPVSKIVEILTEEKTNLEELLNALYKKGKIFIGKTKISEIFIQKYGEMISDIIHKYSKSIGRKLHTSFYSEDFAQESILWVIENKGSIERNFEGDTALQRMIACAKTRCKYLHYKVFKQKKVVSLDESISEDGKLTRYTRVKAKENVQKDVEKIEEKIEISEGDTPITAIQQCLINGMNREESLAFVMQKFNLTQEELLQVLTEELSKRNSIKVAQNGKVYLGGRDIDD